MSVQACAELVAKGDPARFRATMAAPVAARDVLFPIHAFCLEVARAPWLTAEAMIAEMRLQWWHDVLDEIAAVKPARAHEVVAPLAAILTPSAAEALKPCVAARRWDIYRDPHEDQAALIQFLDDSYARPMIEASILLGAPEDSRAALSLLARAGGVARYLAAVPALEAAGRVPLVDGRADAVAALAAQTLADATKAIPAIKRLTRVSRAPLLDAVVHLPLLRKAKRTPSAVAQGALHGSDFQQRFRLINAVALHRW